MSNIKVKIWGREFELGVIYQNYPGEEITETQQETLATIPSVDFDSAKSGIEDYIREYFSYELGEESLDDLFRFVMPDHVLISRTDHERVFAVMCDFSLDMEHGLAAVYENELFKEAGPQDIIL